MHYIYQKLSDVSQLKVVLTFSSPLPGVPFRSSPISVCYHVGCGSPHLLGLWRRASRMRKNEPALYVPTLAIIFRHLEDCWESNSASMFALNAPNDLLTSVAEATESLGVVYNMSDTKQQAPRDSKGRP